MDEKNLLKLWNEKRMQIIIAQIAPALVLTAIFVLAAQGTLATASDEAGYLVIGVAAVTGFLAIFLVRADGSRDFLSLTAIAVIGLGLSIFALVVWAVMG